MASHHEEIEVEEVVTDTNFTFESKPREEEHHEINFDTVPQSVKRHLLVGEKLKFFIDNVHYGFGAVDIPGKIYLTSFRLIFFSVAQIVEIPNVSIWKLKKMPGARSKSKKLLEIQTKECRIVYFNFYSKAQFKDLYAKLTMLAYPESVNKVFALMYRQAIGDTYSPPVVYDALREYERLGLDRNGFRITRANEDYQLCPSYPSVFATHEEFTDEKLAAVSKFRSRGRLPAVVWRHLGNGATISRCSQPCVGLKNKTCDEDVEIFKLLRNTDQAFYDILDSRPKTNAMANALKGGGYEPSSVYTLCHPVIFQNIENIHAVRESLNRLCRLCLTENPNNNIKLKHMIEETKWLDFIRDIMSSAVKLVHLVDGNSQSAAVHCSDGWDRTAQTVALAELIMDPYYRTIEGFIVLIEREWLSFGHQFSRRSGHGLQIANPKDSQRAPIFIQFVDCVWQIMTHFPNAMEFNDKFLTSLVDNVFSCLYGTFLFDSERQRKELGLESKTVSYWYYVLSNKDLFRNPKYEHNPAVIVPPISPHAFNLWREFYMRSNPMAFTDLQQQQMSNEKSLLREKSNVFAKLRVDANGQLVENTKLMRGPGQKYASMIMPNKTMSHSAVDVMTTEDGNLQTSKSVVHLCQMASTANQEEVDQPDQLSATYSGTLLTKSEFSPRSFYSAKTPNTQSSPSLQKFRSGKPPRSASTIATNVIIGRANARPPSSLSSSTTPDLTTHTDANNETRRGPSSLHNSMDHEEESTSPHDCEGNASTKSEEPYS
eukprot:TRINITY_DN714_c0_g1_i1.p1 TRINITY_DN714_c0_g1~~TRINITY_DN714_c0_g1_i1.p1  ORF type:complete len:770 (-),score=209.27 TRINITY_DN714_c0_g1_i1:441-2750(-)